MKKALSSIASKILIQHYVTDNEMIFIFCGKWLIQILKVHITQKNIKKKTAVSQNLSSRGSPAYISATHPSTPLYTFTQMFSMNGNMLFKSHLLN